MTDEAKPSDDIMDKVAGDLAKGIGIIVELKEVLLKDEGGRIVLLFPETERINAQRLSGLNRVALKAHFTVD